jgi:hypothetical protein
MTLTFPKAIRLSGRPVEGTRAHHRRFFSSRLERSQQGQTSWRNRAALLPERHWLDIVLNNKTSAATVRIRGMAILFE